jgi:hypothetical protein
MNNSSKYLFILLVLITLIYAQNSDSVVAHYKLSEEYFDNQVAGKFYDLSGNGNHATPSDTFQFAEDHLGNANAAMRFDGIKDFLNCGDNPDLNLGGNRTINIWFKPDFDYSAEASYNLFSKGDDYCWMFKNGYEGMLLYVFGPLVSRFSEKFHFINHKFHLLTLKHAEGNSKLYMYYNCNLIDVKDTEEFSERLTSESNFYIGTNTKDVWYEDKDFRGLISEVKIYNETISNEQLLEYYNDVLPHYLNWGFEEGVITYNENEWEKMPFSYDEHGEGDGHNVTPFNTEPGGVIPHSGEYCSKHECSPTKHRAEIVIRNNKSTPSGETTTNQMHNEDMWFSYYMLIPDDFEYKNSFPSRHAIVFQMYERQIAWLTTGPSFEINIYPGDTLRASATLWTEDSNGDTAHQHRYYGKWIPIFRNRWSHIVIHHYARDDSLGYYEGWINGEPIFPYKDTEAKQRLKQKVKGEDYPSCWGEKDIGYEYTYKIRDYKVIGQTLYSKNTLRNSSDNKLRGPDARFGYYGRNAPKPQSIYYDDIKVGRTPESIGFNPDDPGTINSHPVISDLQDEAVAEGSSFSKIRLDELVTDENHSDEQISWTYDGNNELIIDMSDGIATISAPDSNWNGSEAITFIATDPEGAQDSDRATFTVEPVNDPPAFTKGADQVIDLNGVDQTVSAWATDISTGPVNESDQSLTFHTSNDNPSLFSSQPEVDATSGDLSFTPAADSSGSATVTVYLTDDGGTSNGGDNESEQKTFTITVTSEPKLEISRDSVDFGKIEQNETDSASISISNPGKQDLSIFSCQLQHADVFNIVDYPEILSYNQAKNIKISFTPEDVIPYTDTLLIMSNSSVNDTDYIQLRGEGGLAKLKIDILKIKVPRRGIRH